jgi:hypothetical protein
MIFSLKQYYREIYPHIDFTSFVSFLKLKNEYEATYEYCSVCDVRLTPANKKTLEKTDFSIVCNSHAKYSNHFNLHKLRRELGFSFWQGARYHKLIKHKLQDIFSKEKADFYYSIYDKIKAFLKDAEKIAGPVCSICKEKADIIGDPTHFILTCEKHKEYGHFFQVDLICKELGYPTLDEYIIQQLS